MKEPKSKLFNLIKGECWRDRHKRRYEFNKRYQRRVKKQCELVGVEFEIAMKGEMERELWIFRVEKKECMWCPWSANAVICGKTQHLHDYAAVLEEVKSCLLPSLH